MKIRPFLGAVFATAVLLPVVARGQDRSLSPYVNPFVGVHGNGNTHPAATLP